MSADGTFESVPQALCFLAAMREEIAPLQRHLADPRAVATPRYSGIRAVRGFWRSNHTAHSTHRIPTLVASFGVGARKAKQAASWLCDQPEARTATPTLLGVAGALDPQLEAGTVLAVREVSVKAGATARRWPTAKPAGFDSEPFGVVLSVERVATSVDDKRQLWQELERAPGAMVDMESAFLLEELERNGIPLAIIRAVSDTADEQMPEYLARSLGPDGLQLGRVLREAARRPSTWAALLRLRRRVRECALALDAAMAEWIAGSLRSRERASE